jgi:macrolide transport system ATP-binding/permease protein
MSLIHIENLELSYRINERSFMALREVNLRAERGSMTAILGPSGSGKSTLLYILGCLLKPTKGTYEFAGRQTTELTSAQLAELRSSTIGFVFQQFHLLPRANVLDNVLLGARYNRSDTRTPEEVRQKALNIIESVGLTSHLTHMPNQLSGGQQQRIAIARALINDPEMILADEPTGNLDSKSAAQILDLLQEIHRQGRTVVIITHDQNVAKRCERVVSIFDGVMEGGEAAAPARLSQAPAETLIRSGPEREVASRHWSTYAATAMQNLLRNKTRSMLTMVGVMIGIAAVLSTITLGDFARAKILESYESLGINKLIVRAYPRWRLKAKDIKGVKFDGVDQQTDIAPMRRLFPEIALLSPVVRDWVRAAQFGGQSDDQVAVLGVAAEYFNITRREVVMGHPFTRFHDQTHSPVCVIGHDVAKKLFGTIRPVGRVVELSGSDSKDYSCLVIGVMASQTSNSEWFRPNEQILLPESYLSIMASRWNSKPYEFDLQMRPGASAEDLTYKIKQFFNRKYDRSAQVSVDSDQLLVAQMRRFLSLFTMLLAGVAFISLAVGGIGITNMMLVSVSERFKEIGLRKALGARDQEIRIQFLVESLFLCLVAGILGVAFGVGGYHLILYMAAKLFPKIQFEWVFNAPAMLLSAICILTVGIASGIAPAIRAEKLEVVEALRSE